MLAQVRSTLDRSVQINLAARLAQGLLAVTIVFAIGPVVQLSLVY
jgi:ABC-type nickel/cobalt efflux system permease component RcnA